LQSFEMKSEVQDDLNEDDDENDLLQEEKV
jgi:hypothetical protein